MGAPEFNSLGGYEEPLEAYEAGPSLMSEMVKPDSVQSTPNQSFLKHQMVYSDLQEHSSQIRISTEWTILTSLRARYPNATVTITSSASGLLSFANAGQAKATLDTSGDRLVSLRTYKPATGRSKAKPGTFGDQVKFGKYDYQWNQKTFIVYEIIYTEGWCSYTNHFIVYKNDEEDRVAGRSKATDELIAAAAQYLIDTHDEVLVFDQEQWTKSNDLWKSVQESSWEDVILDETLKNSLVNEVTSFFDCRNDYKEFAVPWKVL